MDTPWGDKAGPRFGAREWALGTLELAAPSAWLGAADFVTTLQREDKATGEDFGRGGRQGDGSHSSSAGKGRAEGRREAPTQLEGSMNSTPRAKSHPHAHSHHISLRCRSA